MKMTSASLPRLGLGMAALGRPGYINLDRDAIFGADGRSLEKMQLQANLVLDTLFRITTTATSSSSSDAKSSSTETSTTTIPWIDCARSYGLSEKFTGDYLKQNNIKAEEVYVSSKWGYSKCHNAIWYHIEIA
jgi:aryl-alcohol dehydrogenase-like predicted oxidoreductase